MSSPSFHAARREASAEARVLALVPARLASQRLPRKMLLRETGMPLFAHSVANLRASGLFARVVLAADSDEVLDAARDAGVDAVRTRVEHESGTDRIHEAWNALAARGEQADVIVNVQGDEPELARDDLQRLIEAFDDASVVLATLATDLQDDAQWRAPNVVKVVCDRRGDALYFSRAPIPAVGHEGAAPTTRARRHVGVYAFRPEALESFCALPRGDLERRESLEQLRWLENGGRLRVVHAARAPHGIDTRADYEQFVTRVRANQERETEAGAR